MTEDRALYLIVRNKDGEPVAFVHFRFDMEYDEEVLYWYVRKIIHFSLILLIMVASIAELEENIASLFC